MAQTRDDFGHFENKSDEPRLVKSIRVTDSTWKKFGEVADSQNISRADLLESFFTEKEKESFEILEAIEEREKEQNGIEYTIRELILGLEKNGKNELNVSSKEKAIARRVLSSLIDYLVIHG